MKKTGLLVMHYGTPASLEDVEPYYTHIRHGRPPTPELLKDLESRYEAIGGPSPLAHISEEQADMIAEGLKEAGIDAKVYIGMKHTHPFISEAVNKMAEDGVGEAIGVVLAPHFSGMSVAAYEKYAHDARDECSPDMRLTVLQRWGTMPELIEGLAARVKEQMQGWSPEETIVLFSAHSLPKRIVADGDPYQKELEETSALVAKEAGVANWRFCFQSASTTGEPWLGPDILDVLDEIKAEGRFKNVVACTVGFISDHLEVLYDLGIETRDRAKELGLEYRAARTINADPKVMHALGRLLARTIAEREETMA